MSYNQLTEILTFERQLGEYTGAPFVVMTDCCTHAIELCLLYDKVKHTEFTPFTYLSIPMTMRKLGIAYTYNNVAQWIGEYQFDHTRIWDSARILTLGMYRAKQMQCLSFGFDKPLNLGHGGAILLDDYTAYKALIKMRGDGRDFSVSPWEEQKVFEVGYHYRPTIEDALLGQEKLKGFASEPKYKQYPDLREIIIK